MNGTQGSFRWDGAWGSAGRGNAATELVFHLQVIPTGSERREGKGRVNSLICVPLNILVNLQGALHRETLDQEEERTL